MRDWKKFFEGILTERQYKIDEPMSRHTTYGIGGPADVFVMPQSIEELRKVLTRADEEQVPVTVVGGGSNLLVSDKGIRGITICTMRIKPVMECKGNQIIAGGGAGTGPVSRFAWKNSLSGLEFAVGIPGTICGAVFMNANGYGGDFAGIVDHVEAVSRDGKEIHEYKLEDIHYGRSESIFMENGDIVIGAVFNLTPGNPDEIKKAMDDHQLSRRTKQPLEKRSAGTMYIRPKGYYVGPTIRECGLVGYSVGDAEVSPKHPGFVVNNGHASCDDVLAVLHEVQRVIMEKKGVHVPLDVRIVGEGVHQER